MRFVMGFLRFCYDFVIGDCWQIAAGVGTVLVVAAIAARMALIPESVIGPAVLIGVVVVVLVSLLQEARPHRSSR